MLKAVFFDLDGTLLPMDQDVFVKGYFKYLATMLAPHGYAPDKLIQAVWHGTEAMIRNDGSRTNEEAFWEDFAKLMGPESLADKPLFESFYRDEFPRAKQFCGFAPEAAEVVDFIREAGRRVILATNPIFPAVATEQRIRWAGLDPDRFERWTTYENCNYSKPNPEYYRMLLDEAGLSAEDCLMVGNDTGDDMVAETLGMRVFLLTPCLINKKNEDISRWPHGGFAELTQYLKENL
ncbi:MAG: HAD family hydrolase [Clostridia bacterium]|nr:HAD family hydrolase [Clostridia bacterium]